MPRRPRPWLTPDQQKRWHARLKKGDPEDTVVRLLWACLAQDILPSFHFADEPEVDVPAVAAQLAYRLCDAVVATLKRWYPVHAARGTPRLIRTRANAALKLVGHACAWTTDRLYEDLVARPSDPLEARVRRLWTSGPIELPRLRPGSRPAWLGVSYTRKVVVVYDCIRDCLRETFPSSRWSHQPDPRGRRHPSFPRSATDRRKILGELPCLKPFAFSATVLDVAADQGMRGEATYVLTAAVVGLAPTTVPRVVRRARPLATVLDAADRQAGRQ
jgi:hypothetical protein